MKEMPLAAGSLRSFDRRSFLKMAGVGSVALSILTACQSAAPSQPVPAAGGQAAAPGAVGGSPAPVAANQTLPNYVPTTSTKPDLPATPEGLEAGFLTYPKDLVKSVTTPPGSGGVVTIFTQTAKALPTPMEQNAVWKEVNKQVNATLNMQIAANVDYQTSKAATVMASGDLPDMFFLHFALNLTGIPQFVKSYYADLSPFIGGDLINAYPNLAALPTSAWRQGMYDGVLYGVPLVRPPLQYTWFYNRTRFDAVGASQPNNADDFTRILKALTNPQQNQFGIGALAPTFGLVNTGMGDVPQLAMFGTPNNWRVDSAGKLTKDIETEEFRAALGYVRDLYAAGVYYPDQLNNSTAQQALIAGRVAVNANGWTGYQQFWDTGAKADPPQRIGSLHPFSHDGSKPVWHQYEGPLGKTVVKKGSPERVKELLGILNYLAAPFGSQEYELMNYGIRGTDFDYDAKGNPVINDKGTTELNINGAWQYTVSPVQVLFDPNDAEFVKAAYADQQALAPALIRDPTAGLYSAANASKGGQITQSFSDGLGPIVRGQGQLSDLDGLISAWKTGGGDQIRSEYEAAYARAQAQG